MCKNDLFLTIQQIYGVEKKIYLCRAKLIFFSLSASIDTYYQLGPNSKVNISVNVILKGQI